MADGALASRASANGKTTWVWHGTKPIAPYLATATLGEFDLDVSSIDGIPSISCASAHSWGTQSRLFQKDKPTSW